MYFFFHVVFCFSVSRIALSSSKNVCPSPWRALRISLSGKFLEAAYPTDCSKYRQCNIRAFVPTGCAIYVIEIGDQWHVSSFFGGRGTR